MSIILVNSYLGRTHELMFHNLAELRDIIIDILLLYLRERNTKGFSHQGIRWCRSLGAGQAITVSPFKFQVLTLARSPEAVAELANTPSSQVFQDSGLKIQAYISFFFKTFFIDQSTFISFEMDPFQELRNEFSSAIQALRNEIESIKNQPKPPQRPKPCLPDPEKFNGQPLKFDTWLASMKAKLRIDAPAIGDAVAQFYYVYLNLESKVQALVLPQLSYAEDTNTWDYNTILNQLSLVYDNPNKIQEAEDHLLALRQDSGESVAAYIAKFERILYEAKGKDWPDVTKISAFRKGLNPTLRGRLNQQLNLPKSYIEFLRVVQQLGSHSFSSNPTNVSHSNSHQSGSHTKSDPMDLSVVNINSLSASSTSLDERNRRRQQGSCVRCGSPDHWVKNCSMKAHKESDKLWNQQMLASLERNGSSD